MPHLLAPLDPFLRAASGLTSKDRATLVARTEEAARRLGRHRPIECILGNGGVKATEEEVNRCRSILKPDPFPTNCGPRGAGLVPILEVEGLDGSVQTEYDSLPS